jgi:protein-L-isoaspartate(D-aspartate) O-methyltransferase
MIGTNKKDDYKYRGMRKQLRDELKEKGITDEAVLDAILEVPRHLFSDNAFDVHLHRDMAFRIACGQTISHPYTVAYQTTLLQVKKGEKILEVGTGSGYQTCILLHLGAKVFSIERQKPLYDKARNLLPDLGYSAKLFYGDGYKGLPAFAPFDKIIVTAGAPFIPEALISQLKEGGCMVIPVGEGEEQVMTILIKGKNEQYEKIELDKFKFVPLLRDRVK